MTSPISANIMYRKTYTFNLDDNPLFCIMSHIISLAFDNDALGAPGLTFPEQLFRLKAKRGKGFQPISWVTRNIRRPRIVASIHTSPFADCTTRTTGKLMRCPIIFRPSARPSSVRSLPPWLRTPSTPPVRPRRTCSRVHDWVLAAVSRPP